VRLQIMGFCWVFVIFLVCAIAYNDLVKPQYIQAFQVRARSLLDCYVLACLTACRPEVLSLCVRVQFLYFFSSFWGQFGPVRPRHACAAPARRCAWVQGWTIAVLHLL